MKLIDEKDVVEKSINGRYLYWIVDDKVGIKAEFCSSVIMRLEPGRTVKPAHSHPDGEELIYIIEGTGRVYVDGVIKSVKPGVAVLFEKGSVHMVQNNGETEMKVACFYAPKTRVEDYQFHPDVEFESGRVQDD
jgi:uncharacterized cupin superfamily protein